ncbi:MAG: hypothetical protein WA941_22245 [Nitrososphaeraceae archaeon]
MNSHIKDDNHQIVSDYFRQIAKKDMHGLLKLFTDDCIVYEPFSRRLASHSNNGIEKSCLKGKYQIESFFNIVMMASDGLQYEIEFIDDPIDTGYESPNNTTNSTLSSSIVSVLTTFYRNQGADKLQVAD